jgi:hypothetical protein
MRTQNAQSIRWQKNLNKINTLKHKFSIYSSVCKGRPEEEFTQTVFKTEPTLSEPSIRPKTAELQFFPEQQQGLKFRSCFRKKSLYDNSKVLMSVLRKRIRNSGCMRR